MVLWLFSLNSEYLSYDLNKLFIGKQSSPLKENPEKEWYDEKIRVYGCFMMKSSKIDLLIQYAILIAGQEDEYFDRQLGPIHLIKYVYLADLAYAECNCGETFTGIAWQFYKFGPWSQAANERIDPALAAIGANKKTYDYETRLEMASQKAFWAVK